MLSPTTNGWLLATGYLMAACLLLTIFLCSFMSSSRTGAKSPSSSGVQQPSQTAEKSELNKLFVVKSHVPIKHDSGKMNSKFKKQLNQNLLKTTETQNFAGADYYALLLKQMKVKSVSQYGVVAAPSHP